MPPGARLMRCSAVSMPLWKLASRSLSCAPWFPGRPSTISSPAWLTWSCHATMTKCSPRPMPPPVWRGTSLACQAYIPRIKPAAYVLRTILTALRVEDLMKRLWLIVLVVWSMLPSESLAQSWSDVVAPAPGLPRAVGSYTAGCVQGAVALPPEGPGFQTMRRYRRRFFGHPTLIRYLQDLAAATTQQSLGILSIGDLGQARGGPAPSGHASHQTGLDVDIWFWLLPNGHPLPAAERETISAPSMVMSAGPTLHLTQWSPQPAQVLRPAAEVLHG